MLRLRRFALLLRKLSWFSRINRLSNRRRVRRRSIGGRISRLPTAGGQGCQHSRHHERQDSFHLRPLTAAGFLSAG